jgi:hypothetical protein
LASLAIEGELTLETPRGTLRVRGEDDRVIVATNALAALLHVHRRLPALRPPSSRPVRVDGVVQWRGRPVASFALGSAGLRWRAVPLSFITGRMPAPLA